MNLLRKIVGSRNDRILKDYRKILKEINLLSDEVKKLSDSDFPDITEKLKKDYIDGMNPVSYTHLTLPTTPYV